LRPVADPATASANFVKADLGLFESVRPNIDILAGQAVDLQFDELTPTESTSRISSD
jgi:hypothetical protein